MSDISFKEVVQKIMDWNKIAGSDPSKFNRHLENSLLLEEVAETVTAIKANDRVEIMDGFLDIFYIAMGSLYKMGYTPEQVNDCMQEILSANYTKFVKNEKGGYYALLDETGKVKKPEHFRQPNLEQFLNN